MPHLPTKAINGDCLNTISPRNLINNANINTKPITYKALGQYYLFPYNYPININNYATIA